MNQPTKTERLEMTWDPPRPGCSNLSARVRALLRPGRRRALARHPGYHDELSLRKTGLWCPGSVCTPFA